MINEIFLKNVASYDNEGVKLSNLRKVNYFYGSNGSGKTAISELLRNSSQFPDCHIYETEPKYNRFVYNVNFVEENFRPNENIKGIFTLGKDQKETMDSINDKKEDIQKHADKIRELKEALQGKQNERETNKNIFKDKCWELKNKYEPYFKEAFTGYKNSKNKLMDKFVEEKNNEIELKSFENLIQRRETLFDKSLVKVDLLQSIESTYELENMDLLKKKIIGANDVDIAGLIEKLNISDWVFQGHEHMQNTDGVCPFCQQELPNELDTKLHNYFDQTYSDQIYRLKEFYRKYEVYIEDITSQLTKLTTNTNEFINNEKIQYIASLFETKKTSNKNLIGEKLREPSKVVVLQDISEDIHKINQEIEVANNLIKENNNLVTNAEEEKKGLLADIWRYLFENNKESYHRFKSKEDELATEINGRNTGIINKNDHMDDLIGKVSELQMQVTNIEHSVNEINKKLQSFGFTNFKLETASEKGHYKIVRENGEDVDDTLSEGEKTFITFLYFYNLLKGSINSEEVSTNKIVVIDDPISSLDSNVLFIVSNLIREIAEEIKNNTGETKQLILLTHNIYFHKEVTFKKHKQPLSQESFWIVRKTNNKSYVQQYCQNPIKSSYELLWNELNLMNNQSLITTQNVMRRILENYFTFFGGIDLSEVVNKFEDEEKIICRSLINWLHDGSHHINEDLFVERSLDIVERYLEVFMQIFYKMGHGSHFEMMMKNAGVEITLQDEKIEDEINSGNEQLASGIENE